MNVFPAPVFLCTEKYFFKNSCASMRDSMETLSQSGYLQFANSTSLNSVKPLGDDKVELVLHLTQVSPLSLRSSVHRLVHQILINCPFGCSVLSIAQSKSLSVLELGDFLDVVKSPLL